MKFLVILSFLFSLFLFNIRVEAHVGLDFPVGGETFETGSQITISWHAEIDHGPCNWDLYFSSNGGSTWQELILDIPKEQTTYDWTITQAATQQGEIRVVQDNQNGTPYDDHSGVFTIETPTGISHSNVKDISYNLFPAYPNPFNPSTSIKYSVAKTGFVTLKVYDLLGREVKSLVSEEKPAGTYEVTFEGSNLSSGVYLYELSTQNYSMVRKFMLLK